MIPGKIVRGVTTAEKNARPKKLFKKIKRNVNAVGGQQPKEKSHIQKIHGSQKQNKGESKYNMDLRESFFYKKPKVEPFIFSVYMKVNSELWFLTARRN